MVLSQNMNTINLETILPWSAPKEVVTKFGKRILRKSAPNETFSNAWKSSKDALKAAGIGWSKDQKTGEWEVCWWMPISLEQAAQEQAAVAASWATDADIEIPVPAGLAYLPFQRAGIQFALKRFGLLSNSDSA